MFVPSIRFGQGVPDIDVKRIFMYILIIAFIIEISITKARITDLSKWFAILFIFYLIVIASISWSNFYSYDLETLQMLFDKIFNPLFIAFLAHYIFRNKHNVDLYIKNIFIFAGILSLISIFKMLLALGSGYVVFRSGAGGEFANPNALAICLTLFIPCILYGVENKIIPRALGWMVTVSVVAGVLCTVSRKGIVAMALAFFIILIFKKQVKKIVVLLILFTAFIPLLLSFSVFSNRFNKEELQYQLEGKAFMAEAGLHMFKRSPLIGHGYKGYHHLWSEYFPNSRHDRYDAHNIYVTALVSYGILGFIPFIGIFICPLLFSLKIIRRKNSVLSYHYSKQMAIICIASVVPFMVSGWFAGGLFYSTIIISFLYSQIAFVLMSPHSKHNLLIHEDNKSDS